MSKEEIEAAVLEEIRKAVLVRSFRFLKREEQIKLIRRAIERSIRESQLPSS